MSGRRDRLKKCVHASLFFFTFDGSGALFGTAMISEPLQQVVAIVAATVQQTLVSAGVGGVSADRGGSGRRKIQEKDFLRLVFLLQNCAMERTQLSPPLVVGVLRRVVAAVKSGTRWR